MRDTVNTLIVLFLGFFAGWIALAIGYSATPTPLLLVLCWLVGVFALLFSLAAFIYWVVLTTKKA